MVSEPVTRQLQPLLAEMRQVFADHERRIDQRFDEQGRKLDAIIARVDELIALTAFMLGALATLNMLLIGMFVVLFTT